MLFPEASFALSDKCLRVLGGKIQVLGPWWWGAQIFDEFFIPPERERELLYTARPRSRIVEC